MTQQPLDQDQIEAMDDMGAPLDDDYVDPKELVKALAAGRLQAQGVKL